MKKYGNNNGNGVTSINNGNNVMAKIIMAM
jgi:hypothetical protein